MDSLLILRIWPCDTYRKYFLQPDEKQKQPSLRSTSTYLHTVAANVISVVNQQQHCSTTTLGFPTGKAPRRINRTSPPPYHPPTLFNLKPILIPIRFLFNIFLYHVPPWHVTLSLCCSSRHRVFMRKRHEEEVNVTGLSGDFSQSNVQGVQVRRDPRSEWMRPE